MAGEVRSFFHSGEITALAYSPSCARSTRRGSITLNAPFHEMRFRPATDSPPPPFFARPTRYTPTSASSWRTVSEYVTNINFVVSSLRPMCPTRLTLLSPSADTSGKLPKAFKVVPSLHNWEEVLYLTRPDRWTPQAMYAATRIFASNLNPKMAQRFYNLVLLDSVRADIHANRKLNYHYYVALKKAVYKPAAFFKGILLPLCADGSNCTLREAVIVSSVLQKVSIPVHHSAVALHKLATMRGYNGATSIFMRTLLDKKYSLPAPVIESLIAHFARFKDGDAGVRRAEELPVLWHQALLVFVQRYKNDIGVGGKEKLRDLMKVHNHPKITVEVRRELFGSAAWREERIVGGIERQGGNDDVMVM